MNFIFVNNMLTFRIVHQPTLQLNEFNCNQKQPKAARRNARRLLLLLGVWFLIFGSMAIKTQVDRQQCGIHIVNPPKSALALLIVDLRLFSRGGEAL